MIKRTGKQEFEERNKNNDKNSSFKDQLLIFFAISTLILFVALIYVLVSNANLEKNQIIQKDIERKLMAQEIVATVNQEPIYAQTIINIFNTYQEQLRNEQGLQMALEQAINNKLLLQYAKSQDITAKEEDIDATISNFLATNSLSMQMLEERLKNVNSTIEDFRKSTEENIMLQKTIDQITSNAIEPSEDEIKQFYELNKNNLTMLGSSKTRQILLLANQENAQEKLEEIKEIAAMINSTNYCELIELYSQDITTKDNCGLYETTQGQLLPEYESAIYQSEEGELKLIETRIGYHIVLIESLIKPRPADYEESKEQIKQYLALSKKQAIIQQELNKLRENSQIIFNQ